MLAESQCTAPGKGLIKCAEVSTTSGYFPLDSNQKDRPWPEEQQGPQLTDKAGPRRPHAPDQPPNETQRESCTQCCFLVITLRKQEETDELSYTNKFYLTQYIQILSFYSLEGLMLKPKLQYSEHLMQRADSLKKTLMLGKMQEKGVTEDEMVGWYHQLSGVGDGQGHLVCCSPWGRKESDTTERLNNSIYPNVVTFIYNQC